MEIVYDLNQVENVANELLKLTNFKVLLFRGEMGSGKTTLIKSLVKALGSKDEVSSPTFSIVNEYKSNNETIYHFDFYRIKDIEEAYNFGIEDYLNSDAWIFIEWPDIIKDILPDGFNTIKIKMTSKNKRIIKLNY
ncbi:tRNA (adenosine(37)-N6)-threonylcarbamoyltransferase complex ATPase subunit type 1 TsaE [Aestuariivivens sp. NBU2969]|uniref:tRNA (adenosine(37)-N6)-threonylcarbamoyltransferase complex ATPase subunit type 1 TsaE n=1 Tax=Aestuariivivens sp. NBU2969 TaxID=2873267 RepID=UPI001CBE33F0|nr:tRNA (adenosine(37)-N6)-threonylcarbamoyltransferase complex ATPase subunit type 1 TsaE [Aestuariivivens sp. NBU2969]